MNAETETTIALPPGRLVPYHKVIAATRATFERLGNAQAGGQVFSAHVTTVGGRTASIDWNVMSHGGVACTVNMPTLAPHTLLSRADADRMVAYLTHELQHAIRTDKHEWRRVCRAGDTLLRDVVNGLEDARIECAGIVEGNIPGARALWSEHDEYLLLRAMADGFKPHNVGSMPYTLAVLGRAYLGQHDIPSAARLDAMLPAWARPAVSAALAGLPACRDTHDVHVLAIRFCAAIRAAAAQAKQDKPKPEQPKPEQPKTEQPSQGQPCDDGEQGDSGEGQDGEGQGEGQDAPGEGQDGEGQGEGQDGPGEGQDAPGEGQDGEGQGEGQDGPGEGQDAPGEGQDGEGQGEGQDAQAPAQAPAKGKGKGGKGKGAASRADPTREKAHDGTPDPLATILDAIRERNGADAMADGAKASNSLVSELSNWRGHITVPCDKAPAPGAAAQARGAIENPGTLKAKIRQMLRAPGRIDFERRLTTGRLDRRALSRAAIGARDVFSQRHETPSIEVGVMLLLDNSGSMGWGQTLMARTLGIHLADACDAAGAQCAVVTFGDFLTCHDAGKSVALKTLKDWRTKGAAAAAGIARLDGHGGTPLSGSIMACADTLAGMPHLTRRVVLALTDGECNNGQRGVRWAGSYAAQRGVELIGIGLGIDASKAGFRHGITVHRASDLTGRALTALQGALQGAAKARR